MQMDANLSRVAFPFGATAKARSALATANRPTYKIQTTTTTSKPTRLRAMRSSLTIAAGSVTAAIASYYLSRAISKYGAKGFVRLIWEGDHLEPNVREAWDALDGLEASAVPREEKRLEKVEIAFETARLNSVDGSDDQILEQYPQIKKDLSMVSYRLDKVAAEVDSVQSHGNAEVKRRKKHLSRTLVGMMERADTLIASCGGGIK